MQNDELQRLRVLQQQQQQQQQHQQLLLQQQLQQQQQHQRNSLTSTLTGLGGQSAGLTSLAGFGGGTSFGSAAASGLLDSTRFGGLGGAITANSNSSTGSQLQALLLQQQQQQQQQQHGAAAVVQQRLLDQQRRVSLLEQAAEVDSQKLVAAALDQQRKHDKNVIAPGGWQSPATDLPDRRRIIQHVLEIIQQIAPGAGTSTKFNHMAQSLEGHLYRSATSRESYMDLTTLKDRLQATAYGLENHETPEDNNSGSGVGTNPNWSVAELLRNPNGSSDLRGALSSHLSSSSSSDHTASLGLSGGANSSLLGTGLSNASLLGSSSSLGGRHSGNSQLLSSNNSQNNNSFLGAGSMSSLLNGDAASLWQQQQQQQQQQSLDQHQPLPLLDTSNQGSLGSLDASLRRSGNWSSLQQQQQLAQHQQQGVDPLAGDFLASQRSSITMSDLFPQQQQQQLLNQQQQQQSAVPQNISGHSLGAASRQTSTSSSGSSRRVIQQQQNRLLLLRHASKCNKGSSCGTKFCSQMITLWSHIKGCRDKNCKTPHCLSSRCVLNHYRMCRNKGETMTCEVCGPVMRKIKQMDREQQREPSPPTASSESQPEGLTPQQLQLLQSNQLRLKRLLENLQNLQRQQEQLLNQQRTIDDAARRITNPNTEQAKYVFQQQDRLQVLHKQLHDQQQLLQKQVEVLTAPAPEPSSSSSSSRSKPKQQAVRRNSGKGKRIGKLTPRSSSSSSNGESKKKRPIASSGKERASSKRTRKSSTAEVTSTSEAAAAASSGGNKPTEVGVSLLACITKQEVKKHLESLNKRLVLSPRTVTHKCRPLLQKLLDHEFAWVFRDAVDPVELGLSDYFDVIKNPMHLSLIQNRLENAIYTDMQTFAQETCLVFENAILYNGEQSPVGSVAQKIVTDFKEEFNDVVRDIETSHLNLESKGELCSLCGLQKRKFEPTMLYCQGRCGMPAIQRNASYYTDKTKQNHWCQPCYNQMDPDELVALDDGTKVRKNELQDFKNDHLPEEGWVNCDECHSWVHQVCALFNGRANKSNARYTCPNCVLKREGGPPSSSVKRASDLPRCKLSDAIEKGIEDSLESAYAARAQELGVPSDRVEKVTGTSVRILANVDKKQLVGEKMAARYASQGYPSEFPVRSKCIALFQRVHGVDTLLFALYVYEYGHDCPAPNRRRVYISYLDSVQYFEPKCYRTHVYQTIIIEYLRYVKQRGFHTAHIWSCPPTPGDDYIFYCHPKHQLVPREDMLRTWYHKLLDQAKSQGIVIRTTTLYDEYFGEDSTDIVPDQTRYPTCLPYFEGDYIPGEIENIMKRSGGSRSGKRDAVMSRIGDNLAKMKENFIVVHLRNRRFAAAVERGEDVSKWKEDSDDEMVRRKKAKINGKNTGSPTIADFPELPSSRGTDEFKSEAETERTAVPLQCDREDTKETTGDELALLESSKTFDTDDNLEPPTGEMLHDELLPSNRKKLRLGSFEDQVSVSGKSLNSFVSSGESSPFKDRLVSSLVEEATNPLPELSSSQPDISVPSSLIDPQGEEDRKNSMLAMTAAISSHRDVTKSSAFVPDTTDEDATIESDLFESRQQLLNYCQTTHCQFDELRRAKHSTLMVLFQLHNPAAPKFLQQCGACYNDITHGIRYHCNDCNNFDLCSECYEPIVTGEWAKGDPRFAHDKNHRFTPIDMEAPEDANKSLKEKQKSLKAHVDLVEHAASCPGAPVCKIQNCERMKKLFLHVDTCDVKPKKDCRICRRLLALATMHSRMCSADGSCEIPFCDRIRERNNRLRRQQQLMDDRRRRAQNELYHAGGES